MNITNQLGQLTELWCQLDFCERGIVLSQPTNPSSRYDFIAEINDKLYRIQCKTAHEETNNRISIRTVSKNWNNGDLHSYVGEIDFFYTHWNGKGYLLPIELCKETNRSKTIRLGKPEDYTQNKASCIYGKDYEIDVVLQKIDNSIQRITIENSKARELAIKKRNNDRQESDNKKKCPNCGTLISVNSNLCNKCYRESIHPKDMPTRDELKNMIRTLPFTKIGDNYGKSDNAIRKWCDYYSLPRKKVDINKFNDIDWESV